MIRWEKGRVEAVLEEREEVQRLRVRLERTGERGTAIHYPPLLGRAEVGDEVWLNVTAVHLSLGTGGNHFVAGWVKRPPRSAPIRGHIMKLRYTPWQIALPAGEEEGSSHHELLQTRKSLEGAPILIGELHSMLPVAVATWRHRAEKEAIDPRIVYVMTDGGALPAALSQHVQSLTELGWLKGTVTVGHAFGGTMEAVNLYSGLLLAVHALRADLVFVSMGPGIVGTGTPYGFTGVEQGQSINAVHTLGGIPVAIPRMQQKDSRSRHRGLSHHTRTVLASVALAPAVVPHPEEQDLEALCLSGHVQHHWVPFRLSPEQVEEFLAPYPLPVSTMGRTLKEDPLFFTAVSGAAEITWHLWRFLSAGLSPNESIARLRSRNG
jgi:hypothetical protein